MAIRLPLLITLILAAAAGCSDQPLANNSYGSTTPRLERAEPQDNMMGNMVEPVRIGELGRNFAACNAQGEVRERTTEGPIPVRAAPFEQAQRKGELAPGSTFFICSRSLDQRWFGIVHDSNGQASRACGVSVPVGGRKDYEGPCDSGWVASSQVRLIAGTQAAADQPSGNSGKAN